MLCYVRLLGTDSLLFPLPHLFRCSFFKIHTWISLYLYFFLLILPFSGLVLFSVTLRFTFLYFNNILSHFSPVLNAMTVYPDGEIIMPKEVFFYEFCLCYFHIHKYIILISSSGSFHCSCMSCYEMFPVIKRLG